MKTKETDAPMAAGAAKTDREWKDTLSPAEYDVLRCHGTEMRGSSPLNKEHRAGMFRCAGCGQPLFSSEAKFDSGTGWPSFHTPMEGAVATIEDRSHGMVRVEVRCASCDGHLGHVFEDGPQPTGERYCMNGVAMRFQPNDASAEAGID
jgi:peptide-methionine (R)-S-oxide reductase